MGQTRRTFLAATAALAAAPFARAHQAGNKAQVGVLSLYSPEVDDHLLKAFRKRLAALGFYDSIRQQPAGAPSRAR